MPSIKSISKIYSDTPTLAKAAKVVSVQAPIVKSTQAIESNFSSNSVNSSITLSKGYPSFEMSGDTGRKQISTVNSVSETVTLKKGVTYTLSGYFGLDNIKGSVKLDVKNSAGISLKSIISATGKTSSSLSFTASEDGIYTVSLTGQAVPQSKSNSAFTTNLYSSYQIQVTQPLSKLPKSSGNTNIDSLILGDTNAWQHAVGAIASTSANVIDAGLKSLNNVLDNNGVISYAFMDSNFINQLTGQDANKATELDASTKSAVVTAFDYLSTLINVKFEQAKNTSEATIVFGENNQKGISAGYANPPNQSGSHQQYLFLANDAITNDSTKNNGFATGTYGWQTLIHEISHTMGLKHPFNGNAGGGGTPGPYLPAATNNHRFTVMSYSSPSDSKAITTTVNGSSVSINSQQLNPSTLMTYDIAALQYLYGANTSTTSTNAKISNIQKLEFNDAYKGMETIWTPNGATLNASSTTNRNIIDLRGGSYSSINYLGTGSAQVVQKLNSTGINNSSTITSILKNFNTQLTSAYTGSNNVALAYGSKITEADGGKSDDVFYASNYSTLLNGGDGIDTLYLTGSATDWTSSDKVSLVAKGGSFHSPVILTNKKTNAKISINQIEKYSFYASDAPLLKALT